MRSSQNLIDCHVHKPGAHVSAHEGVWLLMEMCVCYALMALASCPYPISLIAYYHCARLINHFALIQNSSYNMACRSSLSPHRLTSELTIWPLQVHQARASLTKLLRSLHARDCRCHFTSLTPRFWSRTGLENRLHDIISPGMVWCGVVWCDNGAFDRLQFSIRYLHKLLHWMHSLHLA